MTKSIKRYFLRGLAALLPTVLTIWIFLWGYRFIQGNISIHINRGLVWLFVFLKGGTKEDWSLFWVDGIGSMAGFLISLVAVFMVGAILASVVGKSLWRMIENFIMNVPLLKQVYPYIKQITDFLFAPEKQEKMFSRVVAVEFPRKDSWAIGMITGSGVKKIVDNMEKEFLTVFVATTPSPLTGFVIMVPKDEVIDIGMTVEDAFRFIISAGVIVPAASQPAVLPSPNLETNRLKSLSADNN